MNHRLLIISALAALAVSCGNPTAELAVEGVSLELAQSRAANISDIEYSLSFSIPEVRSEAVTGHESLSFTLTGRGDLILDFQSDEFSSVKVNGKESPAEYINEHIVIPSSGLVSGRNTVELDFVSDDRFLNRNDEYLYTLFVPSHARSAFPCFDQPDMKASFSLTLEIPSDWSAVSNAAAVSDGGAGTMDRKTVSFAPSEPLPTYLFAFSAGKWNSISSEVGGRHVTAYYRETDPKKIAQFPDIFNELGQAIDWLEDFTGIALPFSKYDFVVIPGFQFGGMEHPGAVFYNENTMFLGPNPTLAEREKRIQLVAHETAHMWFGDMVTMRWFNDVWTKEVYANYFAAEMTEPMFPEINHDLAWLQGYYIPSYSDDRTSGATPIRQDLGNLADAGLIYGNIIYDKAPIVMRAMVDLMGKDNFREGIREYLRTFAYSNADWDELIAILDSHSDEDMEAFSREWVYGKGIPVLENAEPDGKTYGLVKMSDAQARAYLDALCTMTDNTALEAVLIQLYENYIQGYFTDTEYYLGALLDRLAVEENQQIASTVTGELPTLLRDLYSDGADAALTQAEARILALSKTHPMTSVRQQLVRSLASNAVSAEVVDELYSQWEKEGNPLLNENDYITMSYQLAVRKPEKAREILALQRKRIDGSDPKRNFNPDRLRQFDFISRAALPDTDSRDSMFADLLKAENRTVEPWAETALSLLNHFLRDEESVKYVRPGLDALLEVKATGDIFFPASWCRALLGGHRSEAGYHELESFLDDNPDYPQLLRNKILLNSYSLERAHSRR